MIRNRTGEDTGAKSGMTLIWGLILLWRKMEGLSKIFTDECVVLDMKNILKSHLWLMGWMSLEEEKV